MVLRFICPLLYSILVGYSWSRLFRKKFSSSLAPSFFLQILSVLFSGIVFKSIWVGIVAGVAMSAVALLFSFYRDKKQSMVFDVEKELRELLDNGLLIFFAFYTFCFFINSGKVFMQPDEFSHWGLFLKECLRTDKLYCMSPVNIAHKDYVPAITLFETIWCRLSFRFSESDAYKAIQIFMYSLLMPVFECFNEHISDEKSSEKSFVSRFTRRIFRLSPAVLMLSITLIFHQGSGFLFFHSIYLDMAVGLLFFYCLFEVYRKQESDLYRFLVVTISLTVLALSKMTSIALVPLVIIFLFLRCVVSKEMINKRTYILFFPTLIIPIGIWAGFNKFVDKYVENVGYVQSYDGIKFSSLKEVFITPEKSTISFIKEVHDTFIYALLHRDIFIHGSYVAVLVFAIIIFLILARFAKENTKKRMLFLTSIWVACSGVYYALLMYFLYATAFSEYEAVRLASYERYMNSYMLAVIMLLVASYLELGLWKRYQNVYYGLIAGILINLAFCHADVFDQIWPGFISRDKEYSQEYISMASLIINETPEDSGVFIVKRGDTGEFLWRLRFYCSPRTIEGGNVGPSTYDGDIWAMNISEEDFFNSLRTYDYIEFCAVDEGFKEKYGVLFTDPSKIENGKIYRVTETDNRIILE